MMIFNRYYLTSAVIIFTIEVLIALFVNDNFIRPYFGDVLVVVLIYCFIRSFIKVPVFTLAMSVLAFAFVIEFLQYLHIVEVLGLEQSEVSRTVIGTSFEWIDLLAYMAGTIITLVAEKYLFKRYVL